VWNPPRLEAYAIGGLDDLVVTARGLWEPVPDPARAIGAEAIDLVIVPGLAFDRQGHRLGFGAGLYDRFLAGRQLPTVALAFSLQVLDAVPHTHHDVPMDWIVTETVLITCGAA
ncbi:MAG: 5-formyltetrahydrofolate cyclo-ligase, partial [Gemmatimonadota bacterium]